MFLLAGCGGADAAPATDGGPETLTLRYQGSPNAVTLAELAENLGYLEPVTLEWVGNTTSGPQDIQSAATGQTDFGGAHGGAVAKLIESGAPVTAVINYYGIDEQTYTGYYVLDGSPIRGPRDLIGKKVGVNTLGAHHEAVIDTWLKENGLTPEEIDQVELVVVPPINTEESLRRGQIDVGTLSGPLQDSALAVGGIRPLFSDVDLLGPSNNGQLVVRDDFLAENPRTAEILVTGVGKAIEWQRVTPRDQVIAKFTEIIENRGRNESTATLQYWKSVGLAARGGLITDRDFEIWEPWLRDTGAITGDLDIPSLYTNEFNGYRDGQTPDGAPGGTAG
ncbi:ABC transporter substrate-binding protein [Pseudonocardia sp. NPDC046786]|uniref:ABC transporter substrate-binding protein n=1 Tax=Pseudonocardia sp. NPDC046786 TaxID=3155471 RepID=UPI0033F3926D